MSVLFGACGTYHDHSGRDDDIRAVYSWALSHSELRDATLLVSPEILHTAPDDRCLGIPRSNLAQMHTDFERHKQTSKAFPKSLPTTPYVVLDPTTAETLLASVLLSESDIARHRFPRATHILLFSDISFNDPRTIAAVHVTEWCGGMCGRSYWIILQKDRNAWTLRPSSVRCVETP
jgi:hypothetical protein